MDLNSSYQWLLTYGYHIGQALLIMAALLQLKSVKSPLSILCLVGFICFAVGTFVMLQSDGNFFDMAQRQLGSADYSSAFLIGKALNTVGFLLGAGSWLMLNLNRSS
jgi:hypothetical protein